MDASATGRLDWCTTVCSLVGLLIAISLFLFIIFVNVVLSQRWVSCAAYGCLNAYIKSKPDVGFFRFPKQQMRSVDKSSACDLALVSCSLDDQYVQYNAKLGLQCGLRTPQLFGLGKGV